MSDISTFSGPPAVKPVCSALFITKVTIALLSPGASFDAVIFRGVPSVVAFASPVISQFVVLKSRLNAVLISCVNTHLVIPPPVLPICHAGLIAVSYVILISCVSTIFGLSSLIVKR